MGKTLRKKTAVLAAARIDRVAQVETSSMFAPRFIKLLIHKSRLRPSQPLAKTAAAKMIKFLMDAPIVGAFTLTVRTSSSNQSSQ
jgi:hypothetical protein